VIPDPIDLAEKFARISDYWSPRVIATCNGQEVRAAKLLGEFVWHRHDDADELFHVVEGRLTIEFRDGHIELEPGQMCLVPRGVEHRPVAEAECHVLLFEPAGTRSTGNVVDDPRGVDRPEPV
jgi:mannose-6-phosphate isomerase-like protein (cupin superfamily)